MKVMFAVVAVVLVFVSAGAAALSPKERFATSVAAAKANLETPAGRAYDQAISTYFEQHAAPLLMDCFHATKHPDASPFEMVFTLSGEGKVLGVLVWPETNISLCFESKLNSKAFPVPPEDGYMAYMEMRIAP